MKLLYPSHDVRPKCEMTLRMSWLDYELAMLSEHEQLSLLALGADDDGRRALLPPRQRRPPHAYERVPCCQRLIFSLSSFIALFLCRYFTIFHVIHILFLSPFPLTLASFLLYFPFALSLSLFHFRSPPRAFCALAVKMFHSLAPLRLMKQSSLPSCLSC